MGQNDPKVERALLVSDLFGKFRLVSGVRRTPSRRRSRRFSRSWKKLRPLVDRGNPLRVRPETLTKLSGIRLGIKRGSIRRPGSAHSTATEPAPRGLPTRTIRCGYPRGMDRRLSSFIRSKADWAAAQRSPRSRSSVLDPGSGYVSLTSTSILPALVVSFPRTIRVSLRLGAWWIIFSSEHREMCPLQITTTHVLAWPARA